jgi:tetratricopeptide (TPR) repeat protein
MAASGRELAQQSFSLCFDELGTHALLQRVEKGATTAPEASNVVAAGVQLGKQLYTATLAGTLAEAFRLAQAKAEKAGQPVHLRLRVQPPELLNLPWELLYDGKRFLLPASDLFLSRSPVDLPDLAPQPTPLPLKILVIVANPLDLPEHQQLDTDLEEEVVLKALDALIRSSEVKVDFVEEATVGEMQRALLSDDYHIIHFVGHGDFDEKIEQGILVVENEQGYKENINSEQVANLWNRSTRGLRLVLLSSCLTARTSTFNAYGGTAQALLQGGVPAVVAMQFPILADSAQKIWQFFYAALSAGRPVDEALAAGRRALSLTGKENVEWATPTLYLRGTGAWSLKVKAGRHRNRAAKSRYVAHSAAYDSFGDLIRSNFFVGRRKEIREIKRGLLFGSSRVALIHGLGGLGKTTLATKVAEKLLERRACDEVLGINAHAARDRESLATEFCTFFKRGGLNVDFKIDKENIAQKTREVVNLLRHRRLLVIIDNAEDWLTPLGPLPSSSSSSLDFMPEARTLTAEMGELLSQFVGVASDCKFLITSRYEFDLFPRGRDSGLVLRVPLGELSRIEALRFMDRLPAFTDCDWHRREEIYDGVGGNPFIFNLFAERAAKVGVDYVLADLRNIRKEAISTFLLEQIYIDSLNAAAKTLLCRMSVLRRSAPKDCLDALMGTHRIETAMNQLLRWGLMVKIKVKDELVDGEEDRYVMHALVREFGLEKLGEAKREALLAAGQFYKDRMEKTPYLSVHLRNQSEARSYYRQAGEDLIMGWQREPRNRRWLVVRDGRLEKLDGQPGRVDVDLVDYFERWGTIRQTPDEEREYFKTENGKRYVESTYNLAQSEYQLNNWDGPLGAVHLYEECLRAFEILDDQSRLAFVLHDLAAIHQARGNLTEATQLYERSLRTFEELEDRANAAVILQKLAAIQQAQGNGIEALRLYERSLRAFEESGERDGIARGEGQLGDFHFNRGNYVQAMPFYKRSLRLFEELGDDSGIAPVLQNMATIEMEQGNLQEGQALAERSLQARERIGDKTGLAQVLHNLATIHQMQGHWAEAKRLDKQSLGLAEQLGDKNSIAISLAGLGAVEHGQGRLGAALRYYWKAWQLFTELQSPYAQTVIAQVSSIKQRSDEQTFQTLMVVNDICDKVIATLRTGSENERHELAKTLDELTRVPDEESVLAFVAALYGLMTGGNIESLRLGLTEDYRGLFDDVVAEIK